MKTERKNWYNVVVEWNGLESVDWSRVGVVYSPNHPGKHCLVDKQDETVLVVGSEQGCKEFLAFRVNALNKIEENLEKAQKAENVKVMNFHLQEMKSLANKIHIDLTEVVKEVRESYFSPKTDDALIVFSAA